MPSFQKILIIRFSSIGDVVLTSPLLRILHNTLTDAKIDFLIRKEYAELVKYNPNINDTIEFDPSNGIKGLFLNAEKIKKNRYDLVLDLHNNFRSNYIKYFSKSKFYTVNKRIFKRFVLINFKINLYNNVVSVAERYLETLRFMNFKNDGLGLELFLPDEIQSKVVDKIQNFNLQNYNFVVGIAPSAKHFTKIWQKDKYIDLISSIANNYNAYIFLFGSKSEEMYIDDISQKVKMNLKKDVICNMAGKLSLLETAALMDRCNLVISNDTGLMHIAAARKRKVLAIFGSTVKEFGFFPYCTESIIVENNNINCRPCTHIGRDRCPKKHFKCMGDITVERVLNSFKNIMNIK